MFGLVRIAASLVVVAVPASAWAQAVKPGVDQPCMAAFTRSGYPDIDKFIPAEASPKARGNIRGVVARPYLWDRGETVKVCFRSGTQKARARVASYGVEWMKYANVKFDFGDMNDPQMCKGEAGEKVKIDFVNSGAKAGHWSALGKLALKTDHSMNLSFLGGDELPRISTNQAATERYVRSIVLHEFGHALGMLHEHQSPRSGCSAEFYEEAVIAYGAVRGWSADLSRSQMLQLAEHPELNATEVDRRSIMHYSLPPWLFKTGEKSPCHVQQNLDLSDGDKAFMAKIYPKGDAPDVVAVGPPTSTTLTRGAKPPAAVNVERLVEDYKRSLIDANIDKSKLDGLVRAFRSSLGK